MDFRGALYSVHLTPYVVRITSIFSDIDTQLLSSCLHSRLSRPLDLLIRTSGEVRLSDFLVWSAATSGTVHKFVSNFWPEFSFWEFAQSILYYQLSNTYLSVGLP